MQGKQEGARTAQAATLLLRARLHATACTRHSSAHRKFVPCERANTRSTGGHGRGAGMARRILFFDLLRKGAAKATRERGCDVGGLTNGIYVKEAHSYKLLAVAWRLHRDEGERFAVP